MAKTTRGLRSSIFECGLKIRGPGSNAGPLSNLSCFLHKLEHCSGENAEVLHNHLKQQMLEIKEFGVEPNSREAITVVVSSFTGYSSNLVAYHADEIFKLDNIDALTAYVRVGFSDEDLEGKNLYSLYKLDQFNKSLYEYTQEFNSS